MGLFSRHRPAARDVHVADPRFDDWDVVGEYEDVATATAFSGRLSELGFDNALTADHPPDRFGRGDIYLCVQAGRYGDATVALDGLEP
jgi:hypothetical protein